MIGFDDATGSAIVESVFGFDVAVLAGVEILTIGVFSGVFRGGVEGIIGTGVVLTIATEVDTGTGITDGVTDGEGSIAVGSVARFPRSLPGLGALVDILEVAPGKLLDSLFISFASQNWHVQKWYQNAPLPRRIMDHVVILAAENLLI